MTLDMFYSISTCFLSSAINSFNKFKDFMKIFLKTNYFYRFYLQPNNIDGVKYNRGCMWANNNL